MQVNTEGTVQWERMERRIHRATRFVWVGFGVLCILVFAAGTWLGWESQAPQVGAYVALGVIAVCAGYAMVVAPWQLGRAVRSEQGRFPESEARVRRLLEPLCQKAEIETLQVMIVPTRAMNAFAAGLLPKRQYIGVTAGALQHLSDRELSAVLAHEISHVCRKDTLYLGWWVAFLGLIISATVALAVMGMVIGSASRQGRATRGSGRGRNNGESGLLMALFAIVVGIAAVVIIKLWLRADMRRREVLADEHAVLLTGGAKDLANALERLKQDTAVLPNISALSLFFAFEPVRRVHWWQRLFDTHPNIDWRIQRLRTLSRNLGEEE